MTAVLHHSKLQQQNMSALTDNHNIDPHDDTLSAKADSTDPPSELPQQVIRQIDYYFSKENLATDKHLLRLLNKRGEKNNPVPLETICSWNKMRVYKYDLVVKAVKDCANVDLLNQDGKWFVRRKTPFLLLDQFTGEERIPTKKKPKKKPTGFEQYYADAPITPAAFAEEQALYDPIVEFPDRIETAIQRYAQKRRFHQNPLLIFNKWMSYGGIDCSQKMFTGGIDQAMLEDKTKDEITAITAANFVGDDKYGPDAKWAVDFEEVAKGFLSSEAPAIWDLNTQNQIQECTNIMRNFYNYLLHHSVCPEHSAPILAARKVCDIAEKELLPCHLVLVNLPGNFNTACSILFGGAASGKDTEKPTWLAEDDNPMLNLGMPEDKATKVFKFGIATHATDEDLAGGSAAEVQHRILNQQIVKLEEKIGLEVVDIVPADPEHVALHTTKHGLGKGQALGKLRCRSWKAPSFEYFDLPPSDTRSIQPTPKTYEIWLEQHILDSCFIGMKIEGTVATLSSGLRILDKVTAVRCSFYTLLVNDLISVADKWKEPVEVTRGEWHDKMKEKEEWRKALAGPAEADGVDDADGTDSGRAIESMPRPEVEFVKVDGCDYGDGKQQKVEDEGVAGLVEEEVD